MTCSYIPKQSLIYTGRPLRVKKTPVNLSWDSMQTLSWLSDLG